MKEKTRQENNIPFWFKNEYWNIKNVKYQRHKYPIADMVISYYSVILVFEDIPSC